LNAISTTHGGNKKKNKTTTTARAANTNTNNAQALTTMSVRAVGVECVRGGCALFSLSRLPFDVRAKSVVSGGQTKKKEEEGTQRDTHASMLEGPYTKQQQQHERTRVPLLAQNEWQ